MFSGDYYVWPLPWFYRWSTMFFASMLSTFVQSQKPWMANSSWDSFALIPIAWTVKGHSSSSQGAISFLRAIMLKYGLQRVYSTKPSPRAKAVDWTRPLERKPRSVSAVRSWGSTSNPGGDGKMAEMDGKMVEDELTMTDFWFAQTDFPFSTLTKRPFGDYLIILFLGFQAIPRDPSNAGQGHLKRLSAHARDAQRIDVQVFD